MGGEDGQGEQWERSQGWHVSEVEESLREGSMDEGESWITGKEERERSGWEGEKIGSKVLKGREDMREGRRWRKRREEDQERSWRRRQ